MTVAGIWSRYFWGSREKHPDLEEMRGSRGIYFIACNDKVVYIGQSIGATSGIATRSIQSLAKCFHQISDANLPWSIGLTHLGNEDDLNELESTAIRKYAPIFNTSIPSKAKSNGREPKIEQVFRVFADQAGNCVAFDVNSLQRQAQDAAANPSPPWLMSKKRPK